MNNGYIKALYGVYAAKGQAARERAYAKVAAEFFVMDGASQKKSIEEARRLGLISDRGDLFLPR